MTVIPFRGLFRIRFLSRRVQTAAGVHFQIHGEPAIRIKAVILGGICPPVCGIDRCVTGHKIREGTGITVRAIYRNDRSRRVLHQLELSFPVDEGKAAECLRKIMQEITPCLNVIIRVDAKKLGAIWQGFDFCLRLGKLHMAGSRHRGQGNRTG